MTIQTTKFLRQKKIHDEFSNIDKIVKIFWQKRKQRFPKKYCCFYIFCMQINLSQHNNIQDYIRQEENVKTCKKLNFRFKDFSFLFSFFYHSFSFQFSKQKMIIFSKYNHHMFYLIFHVKMFLLITLLYHRQLYSLRRIYFFLDNRFFIINVKIIMMHSKIKSDDLSDIKDHLFYLRFIKLMKLQQLVEDCVLPYDFIDLYEQVFLFIFYNLEIYAYHQSMDLDLPCEDWSQLNLDSIHKVTQLIHLTRKDLWLFLLKLKNPELDLFLTQSLYMFLFILYLSWSLFYLLMFFQVFFYLSYYHVKISFSFKFFPLFNDLIHMTFFLFYSSQSTSVRKHEKLSNPMLQLLFQYLILKIFSLNLIKQILKKILFQIPPKYFILLFFSQPIEAFSYKKKQYFQMVYLQHIFSLEELLHKIQKVFLNLQQDSIDMQKKMLSQSLRQREFLLCCQQKSKYFANNFLITDLNLQYFVSIHEHLMDQQVFSILCEFISKFLFLTVFSF